MNTLNQRDKRRLNFRPNQSCNDETRRAAKARRIWEQFSERQQIDNESFDAGILIYAKF